MGEILSSGHTNPNISHNLPKDCLKATFASSKTFGLFTAYFDAELYHYAATYYDTHVFGRKRPMYAIVGIAKVLENAEISNCHRPLYRDIQRFIEEDFCQIHDDIPIIQKFSRFFTAMLYIELVPQNGTGDVQILSVSDDRIYISKPEAFQKNRICYVMQSYAGKLEIVVKSDADGRFGVTLMGSDVRDAKDKSKFIPYWIDYTKLMINGKTIFDEIIPAWCRKPYIYKMDAKAGEEITVQVEWLPHRSDT